MRKGENGDPQGRLLRLLRFLMFKTSFALQTCQGTLRQLNAEMRHMVIDDAVEDPQQKLTLVRLLGFVIFVGLIFILTLIATALIPSACGTPCRPR